MEPTPIPVHTVTGLTNAHLADKVDLIKLDLAGPNGPACELFITASNLQKLVMALQLVQQRWAAGPGAAGQTKQ